MKYPDNIEAIAQMGIDYLGFIFYEGSARYVGEDFVMPVLPAHIEKVAVFVNHPPAQMIAIAKHYNINVLQLHGEESPEICQMLQAEGFCIVKAFALDAQFEMDNLMSYEAVCDYFLFDTKGAQKGGNGVAFDWRVLDTYQLSKPFFLSGGIGWEEVEAVKLLLETKKYPLHALDLNSRLESRPGYKDEALSKKVVEALQAIQI